MKEKYISPKLAAEVLVHDDILTDSDSDARIKDETNPFRDVIDNHITDLFK